jgi:phage gp16-like protein
MSRNSNLAKIHIAKKRLGMGEVDYRALLKNLTGKDSAAVMNPREHIEVIRGMEALGFQPLSTKNEIESLRRMIKKLFHQISRANNEALALRRRLFKFNHMTDLEQLSLKQLREVYEDLERVAYRGHHCW